MKKWTLIITILFCLSLLGCGNGNSSAETTENTEPAHVHTFEEWRVTGMATCRYEGVERRKCTTCKYEEKRTSEKKPHTFKEGSYICSVCRFVDINVDEAVVEMGNPLPYGFGNLANYAWDIQIWDGKIYRGAGDYDKNSGDTAIMAFNLTEGRWETTGTATDEAIHRFVEIDGKLYAPGIDSRDGGWELGNYYALEDGRWQKVRNVPNGIHCFDMIGFDGKMFIGVGTEVSEDTVAVSSDAGKTWSYLPLYSANGAEFDTSPYEWSRTYAFAEYNGTLHALLQFKKNGVVAYDMLVFRYENGKMVYEAESRINSRVTRNYWQSKFEFNGKCFISANGLYAVTDFAKPETHKKIEMPNKEMVSDAIVYNDELYVLSCLFNKDNTIKTVIYKSATGESGSFTEVASFNYGARAYSFDFDGKYFYVGTGAVLSTDYNNQAGMVLRVKPNIT